MDVLLHLAAPHIPIRIWSGGLTHSLAQWIRTTAITPLIWQRLSYRDWSLEEYDILETSPPLAEISYLFDSLVQAIHRYYCPRIEDRIPRQSIWTTLTLAELP
jgi:hypothetical protein